MLAKIVLCLVLLNVSKGAITNLQVERNINLSNQLVKTRDVITVKNNNEMCVENYTYVMEAQNVYMEFFEDDVKLKYEILHKSNDSLQEFNLHLQRPIEPEASAVISANVICIEGIKRLYKIKKPEQPELFGYTGNLYFYSKYFTVDFNCKVNVKKPIIHVSEKFYEQDGVISYRSINLKPFSSKKFEVIYENNDPFYVVDRLERTVDVSHYGKIFVEDSICIRNGGSKISGPYEESQANRKWFYTYLPASAEDIRFFDVLGNSSKTEVVHSRSYKTLQFQLRYPLVRGWKSAYTLQYSIPTHEYVRTNHRQQFRLKMRVIDHILNDLVVQNAVVKVLLPEGAKILHIETPSGFHEISSGLSYTSLSIFGRPTLEFYGNSLIENHIAPFKAVYYLSPVYMYKVPALIAAYIQIVFILIIVIRRFNMKIGN